MSDDSQSDSSPDTGFFAGLKRAFGRGARKRSVSEEEFRTFVTDNDELPDTEKRMIGDILELGELTVRDVMTPRVDIIAVEGTETVRQAVERMQGTGYSRLPVFTEDLDTIVGIVHLKDLATPLLEDDDEDEVAPYAHEALFVPETKDLLPLLSEMQTNRQQMAVVVDEYGGTDGIITVEDIVEEIVGEILDESDAEDSFISQVSDSEWLADGRLPVEDAIKLGWPVEESDQYDTLAGWLLDTIDVVPQVGDEFTVGAYRFKVLSMRRRRIRSLRVTRLGREEDSWQPQSDCTDRETHT